MSIKFMLDNSVLSETSKPRRNDAVMKFLESEEYIIPAGALMEVQFGIASLMEKDPVKAGRLTAWYAHVIASGVPIAETGPEVAQAWGVLATDQRLKNLRIQRDNQRRERPLQDLHIAAAAIAHNAVIATLDVHDFMLIHRCHALPGVYNPAEGKWYACDPVRALLRTSAVENRRVRLTMNDFLKPLEHDDEVPQISAKLRV
ncbi:hypothetical protein ASF70_01435 [Rhizobium sp. Leaf321]|uniref:PIN domain-containing protein n=1 Tax=Rhizobium sp. Leaf321 TaxID=1736335 RepID=UPI000714C675|nr:PIN domain-containing protein [Rhizobium sp. Leaf321]KQQ79378.1 hypothetical protein ASF70_01435 [Rhizobium sp. Leaf321]